MPDTNAVELLAITILTFLTLVELASSVREAPVPTTKSSPEAPPIVRVAGALFPDCKVTLIFGLIVNEPSDELTTPVIVFVPANSIITLSPQTGTEAPVEPPLVADQDAVFVQPLFTT